MIYIAGLNFFVALLVSLTYSISAFATCDDIKLNFNTPVKYDSYNIRIVYPRGREELRSVSLKLAQHLEAEGYQFVEVYMRGGLARMAINYVDEFIGESDIATSIYAHRLIDSGHLDFFRCVLGTFVDSSQMNYGVVDYNPTILKEGTEILLLVGPATVIEVKPPQQEDQ